MAVVLVFSLSIPASALGWTDSYTDDTSRRAWGSAMSCPNLAAFDALFSILSFGAAEPLTNVWWHYVDKFAQPYGSVTLSELSNRCSRLNYLLNLDLGNGAAKEMGITGPVQALAGYSLARVVGLGNLSFEVKYDVNFYCYRIYEKSYGLFVTDSVGRYPFYRSGEFGDGGSRPEHDKWIPYGSAGTLADGGLSHIVSRNTLETMITTLQLDKVNCYRSNIGKTGKYFGIRKGTEFYADAAGHPYICPVQDDSLAANQSRPQTSVLDEEGKQVINDLGDKIDELNQNIETGIDMDTNILYLPDGSFQFIDNLYYDASTKTYMVDSHDTTNINFTYNYYYEFHINYTSITYIGQTEEYDKYYEVYYELPDGRDSADLTREEVEQLNVSIDVVPYGRSADDTSLRSLYHFDGDVRDSSYWNYLTDFHWNEGSSITYMDAGSFNGALYLDENVHDYTVTLPSGLGSGDFTIQFRYYQSHTVTPVSDSYISVGGQQLLKFTGLIFQNGSGTALATTPVGTWNEIALIRDSGMLRYYLNGVQIGTVAFSTPLGSDIHFHFGTDQQTYKYFDELRVLNKALVKGGKNYSPTSVPFDTNLALVLPTDATPVADEYWEITGADGNLLEESGVARWYDGSALDSSNFSIWKNLTGVSANRFYTSPSWNGFYTNLTRPYTFPEWYCYDSLTDIFCDGSAVLTTNEFSLGGQMIKPLDDRFYHESGGNSTYYYLMPSGGIWTALTYGTEAYLPKGQYTFTVLFADGDSVSYSFDSSRFIYSTSMPRADATGFSGVVSHGYRIGIYHGYLGKSSSSISMYFLVVQPVDYGSGEGFVYLSLAEGSDADISGEFVQSVTAMTPDQLRSPTLAVRTDLAITDYQIGGVRPSVPHKGQVWALVESGRITSIQIYNGSAWESCEGRIWTGSRWIPASSYNVLTLKDLYDIVDGSDNYEYIYTESGFWSWWQKSWNAFTTKLFASLGTGGGVSGGDGVSADTLPNYTPSVDDEEGGEGWSFIDLTGDVVKGIWHIGQGIIRVTVGGVTYFVQTVSDAGEFFTPFTSDNADSGIYSMFNEEGSAA